MRVWGLGKKTQLRTNSFQIIIPEKEIVAFVSGWGEGKKRGIFSVGRQKNGNWLGCRADVRK